MNIKVCSTLSGGKFYTMKMYLMIENEIEVEYQCLFKP